MTASFAPEADYLNTILETRDRLCERRIPFGNAFLDDALGGIYPDDLVLFGAGTGVGKTALALSVIEAGLASGLSSAHLFALEATPGEVTARLAFAELAKLDPQTQDFADFWRGRTRQQESRHWATVVENLRPVLSRLHTLYRSKGDFTNAQLAKRLEELGPTGLVALDHLHVVDSADGAENSTQRKTVRLLCDLPMSRNIPVVAASHVRKPQGGESRRLVPDKEDLLGSKHISGLATVIVMVAPDRGGDPPQKHLAPTYFVVDKDRRGRSSALVARMYYDKYRGCYQDSYVLGRAVWKDRAQGWDPLPEKLLPHWASRETRNTEQKPF